MSALLILASCHLITIAELFPGSVAAPNAQYLELRMDAAGQTLVGSTAVTVRNASDALVGTFTFSGSVSNGTSGGRILLATADAQSLFAVSADLAMTPVINAAGGKVCYSCSSNCVAWGNYAGSTTSVAKYSSSLPRSLALHRASGSFSEGAPTPTNNAGASGTIPPSTCGDGMTEGLELCDDGNTAGGDGCEATCMATASTPDAGPGTDAGAPDSGAPDSGAAAATSEPEAGGCGCGGTGAAWVSLLACLALRPRRRR